MAVEWLSRILWAVETQIETTKIVGYMRHSSNYSMNQKMGELKRETALWSIMVSLARQNETYTRPA
jgi:hypothetical protein